MPNFKPTHNDEKSLKDAILTVDLDVAEAVDWVASHCLPEDVFEERELMAWAEENGYVKQT